MARQTASEARVVDPAVKPLDPPVPGEQPSDRAEEQAPISARPPNRASVQVPAARSDNAIVTWARRVMIVLGSFWLATAIVPGWLIGGFLLMAITAVVLEARPTPWAAGLLFVAFDLAWVAATVATIRIVIRKRRARRHQFSAE